MSWPFAVVLASPDPEVEAWYAAGFEPVSDYEARLVASLGAELGFDPTQEPHRLTAQPNDLPTDSKRVLDALTQEDEERARLCLDTALEVLERRGRQAGLVSFLEQVRQEVVSRV